MFSLLQMPTGTVLRSRVVGIAYYTTGPLYTAQHFSGKHNKAIRGRWVFYLMDVAGAALETYNPTNWAESTRYIHRMC